MLEEEGRATISEGGKPLYLPRKNLRGVAAPVRGALFLRKGGRT